MTRPGTPRAFGSRAGARAAAPLPSHQPSANSPPNAPRSPPTGARSASSEDRSRSFRGERRTLRPDGCPRATHRTVAQSPHHHEPAMTDMTSYAQCAETVPTSTARASRRATSATAAAGTRGTGALLRPGPFENRPCPISRETAQASPGGVTRREAVLLACRRCRLASDLGSRRG